GGQQGGQQASGQGGQQGGQQGGGGGQQAAVVVRPIDRFNGRLDDIQGYFDRGDCGGAARELQAIFGEGPDELLRAGLTFDEINSLQGRLDGLLMSLARC